MGKRVPERTQFKPRRCPCLCAEYSMPAVGPSTGLNIGRTEGRLLKNRSLASRGVIK
jgi:hypothetical protein